MMIVARSILCFQSSLNTLAKAPKAASVHTHTHHFIIRLLHVYRHDKGLTQLDDQKEDL